MQVEIVEDPVEFLTATRVRLASKPAHHNLVLSIAHGCVEWPVAGRYAWAHERGRVVAVALQAPLTFAATLGPGSTAGVRALARAFASVGPDLPGVNGEAGTAAAFAGEWASAAHARVVPRDAQRLYRAARVRAPRDVPGALREVGPAERADVTAWVARFHEDIGEPSSEDRLRPEVDHLVASRELWCWDDDGPVAITSATPTYEGVARVRHVYTPPERRRRGYAAACVAAVTARRLAGGAGACVLYTQLTNPTSNAVYRRLGYRPIAEIITYGFGR